MPNLKSKILLTRQAQLLHSQSLHDICRSVQRQYESIDVGFDKLANNAVTPVPNLVRGSSTLSHLSFVAEPCNQVSVVLVGRGEVDVNTMSKGWIIS